MKRLHLLAIFTLLGASRSPATEAMLGDMNSIGGYVTGTGGWTFSPTVNISVTDLGAYDYLFTSANDPSPISVGLWNANGTLLASSSVSFDSVLVNATRYEAVTPTFLSAGLTYYIGAYAPGGTIVLSGEDPGMGGSVTMSPEINIGMAVYDPGAYGFPTTSGGNQGSALIAPNFQFVDAVPEPSSGAFLILGLSLLANNKMQRTKRIE